MREIISVTYQAEDGVVFNNPLSCEAYERFEEMLKIYTRGNAIVSFLLEDANETAKCRNCGQKIAYSVKKIKKESE
mgnify:CR=1 FL=1